MSIRKVAAHRALLPDGQVLRRPLITLEEGRVLSVSQLQGEEARTEWLGGTIRLQEADGQLQAWHAGQQIL